MSRVAGGAYADALSTSTMRTLRTVLHQALNEEVITEKITRNVAETLRVPKARKPRRKVVALSKEDGLRLLEEAKPTRLYALYVLLAMVGLRRGEALALRWSDFDESASTLRVARQVTRVRGVGLTVGPTKSQAGQRTIALPARCVEVLKAHRTAQHAHRESVGKRWKEHGLIFPNTIGTHMEPRGVEHPHVQAVQARRAPAPWPTRATAHRGDDGLRPRRRLEADTGDARAHDALDDHGHLRGHGRHRPQGRGVQARRLVPRGGRGGGGWRDGGR